MNAAYLAPYASEELEKRAREAVSLLSSCELRPRRRQADRLNGERGGALRRLLRRLAGE